MGSVFISTALSINSLCLAHIFCLGLLMEVFDLVIGEAHGPKDLPLPHTNSDSLDEAKTEKQKRNPTQQIPWKLCSASLLPKFANKTMLETSRIKEEVPLSSNMG